VVLVWGPDAHQAGVEQKGPWRWRQDHQSGRLALVRPAGAAGFSPTMASSSSSEVTAAQFPAAAMVTGPWHGWGERAKGPPHRAWSREKQGPHGFRSVAIEGG